MFRFSELEDVDDDNVEKEIIKLYDLKFESKQKFLESETELEDKKEEDLGKNYYYRIEEKKLKELEKAFKQVKTNIKLIPNLKQSDEEKINLPGTFFNIKKEGIDKNSVFVYNEKFSSKLIEIEASDSDYIFSVEKLENNDLIILIDKSSNYELLVYRPEPKKGKKRYFLSQKIIETFEGYKKKYKYKKRDFFDYYSSRKKETSQPIMYNLFYIKAISRNRFFCVSNYGFKIYALNEKNDYELILLEPYEKIDFIHEIDTNKFIFGINKRTVEGYGFCGNAYTCYYKLLLNLIELKNINEIKNKTQKEKSDYYELENNEKNSENFDSLKIKEKLKFSFVSQEMLKINRSSPLIYDNPIYFSDFVILKNKYFIIMIGKNIFIFNLETGKKIKKFEIIVDYFYDKMDIKKWDCLGNDEFIMIVNNNIILFKLNEEDSSKITLSILNYAYFPGLIIKDPGEDQDLIIKDLKKINNRKNRFYSYNKNFSNILIY